MLTPTQEITTGLIILLLLYILS